MDYELSVKEKTLMSDNLACQTNLVLQLYLSKEKIILFHLKALSTDQ